MIRRSTTRRIVVLSALSAVCGYAAGCEQEVVPVATAVSTGGGMTGVGGSMGGTNMGGAGVCGTKSPMLPLEDCGGTSSVGTGVPFECESSVCDASDARWTAVCTTLGCKCLFDDVEVCQCDFDPPLSVCDSIANCCPSGWPSSP